MAPSLTTAQYKTPLDWPTTEEVLLSLKSPHVQELKKALIIDELAVIAIGYVGDELGRNASKWHDALIKLKICPDRVPPLPLNIHETMNKACPIFPSKQVKDTHSLFLIPSGTIDELAELFYGESRNYPYLTGAECNYNASIRTKNTTQFEDPEWILISNLLPGSQGRSYEDQITLVAKIQREAFLNYEYLSFKYALAATLLNLSAEGEGLWLEGSDNIRYTRVREQFWKDKDVAYCRECESSGDTYNLIVGSERSYYVKARSLIGSQDSKVGEDDLGIAIFFKLKTRGNLCAII